MHKVTPTYLRMPDGALLGVQRWMDGCEGGGLEKVRLIRGPSEEAGWSERTDQNGWPLNKPLVKAIVSK